MCSTPSPEFEALASKALELEPLAPDDRRHVLRGEAALLVDGLLTRVARQHGALDLAIGTALQHLENDDGVLRFGASGFDDYIRNRLGTAPRTGQDLIRLARELASRPLLAEAVRSGEVSIRKAQMILSVAQGEYEERWVDRARRMTVRGLRTALRKLRAGEEESPRSHLEIMLRREQRETVDRALKVARQVIGRGVRKWELLQAMCEQYLTDHPAETVVEGKSVLLRFALKPSYREWLEHETAHWDALEKVDGVAAPEVGLEPDPFKLDETLRELVAMQNRWDGLVGHLAMLVQMLGLWREMGFRSFADYCTERLQMGVRTVEQRAALERKLYELPGLREALDDGRVSYEKARIVARHASERTIGEWIERAERTTCVELERIAEAGAEPQMCRSSSLLMNLPDETADLLEAACLAVQRVEGRRMAAGDCLELLAQHFLDVWEVVVRKRKHRFWRVLERDCFRCQVPGCSRVARHVHHIQAKKDGGSDDEWNLVSLCTVHHLRGVHKGGYISVQGFAPDRLRWELGIRPGRPPLMVVQNDEFGVRRKAASS